MITDLLKTKLTIADKACEGSVRAEIDKFYSETIYDGSRFRVPSFKEVANTLLQLISRKERAFNAEINRVMATTQAFLDEGAFEEVQRMVEALFDKRHYRNRLNVFVNGIKSKAASYGVPFDPTNHRVDLAADLYEAGVNNSLRQARASVIAELALYMRNNEAQSISPKNGATAIKAFWVAHWQWIIGTGVAIVGIIVSVI